MSIASEITRLQNAKAAIKAAIEAKGVTVGDETLDEYADLIEEIDTGETEKNALKAVIDRSITEITIPSEVTIIGSCTFYNCKRLVSVILHNEVTTISTSAFQACTALNNINIPNSVTSIMSRAFQSSGLTTIILRPTTPPTLGSNVFDSSVSGRKIYVPAESVNDYKTATNWSEYANEIEAIPNGV